MADAYRLRAWTDVVRPHPDVASGDLSLGTYAANLAAVAMGTAAEQPVYTDPATFFGSTYFTPTMRGLLEDVFGVLAGRPGNRVVQLRTPFGGGKTHTLLSLYHLATSRSAAAGVPELDAVPDPGPVRVAVLSGEWLDPERGRQVGGHTISTLWGELAYQLGGWEAYESILVDGSEGVPPGGEVLGRLLSGEPALILLDEVLVYVAKGMAVRRGDTTAEKQSMLFLQNLTEAVNQQPKAAMVYSLQMSVGEAIGQAGLLASLEKIAGRIDVRREPVTGDEVLRVVQRRLFAEVGEESVRRQVAEAYASLLLEHLRATAETEDARREADEAAGTLERRVMDAHPFHPELLDLMNERWGSLPSYQRTRGALQFLATVVHNLWVSRGSREPQALIGPGDVDLADEQTRLTFFEQVGETEQYNAAVQADFLAADAGTRLIDERIGRDSAALGRLRVGTRVATSIMLLSFGAREEGPERGALEREVVAASLVPGLDGNVVRAALSDLRREALLYLHYAGGRFRFETKPNLNKVIAGEQEHVGSSDLLDKIREALEASLGNIADRGSVVMWPEGPGGIPDEAGAFRIVYLGPDWSEVSAPLADLVDKHREGGPRQYKNGLAFVQPQRTSFDSAREAARTALAIERLIAAATRHNFSSEQRDELLERLSAARSQLQGAINGAYERVSLPTGLDESGGLRFESVELGTILGAGRPLHERVREALDLHVFSSVTAARVKQMARLDENDLAWCDALADGVYRYFEFPKLWKSEPLRAAIAEGVQNGLFAYSASVEELDSRPTLPNPELLRMHTPVQPTEVDLGPGSAILTISRARELVPTSPAESGAEGAETRTVPEAGTNQETPTALTPTALTPTARDEYTTVRLEIKATEDDLHTIQLALSGLRDLVRPGSMRIELSVEARSDDGPIDQMRFQNLVREPLDEDPDVSHTERWE